MGVFNGEADYDNDYATSPKRRRSDPRPQHRRLARLHRQILAGRGHSRRRARRSRPSSATLRRATATRPIFAAPAVSAAPDTAAVYTSHLFAGAKEVELLDDYSDALGTPLEQAIDWGWFDWFMKPIFSLLNWLFVQIGNFGVAIICLTFIVRLLLFPIAQKQFASMAEMRVLQPKMKALQERYEDDKPRMQQEMMKLYKEEKVNPIAGCLPILLQIPIFYALYKVLLVSVEMRHQPFALWIKDLSAPDPLTPVNLFGYLAFHAAQPPRHRRAADPARRHHVAADQAEPADARSGAAADLRADALGADVRRWRRSRPACSSTG